MFLYSAKPWGWITKSYYTTLLLLLLLFCEIIQLNWQSGYLRKAKTHDMSYTFEGKRRGGHRTCISMFQCCNKQPKSLISKYKNKKTSWNI